MLHEFEKKPIQESDLISPSGKPLPEWFKTISLSSYNMIKNKPDLYHKLFKDTYGEYSEEVLMIYLEGKYPKIIKNSKDNDKDDKGAVL